LLACTDQAAIFDAKNPYQELTVHPFRVLFHPSFSQKREYTFPFIEGRDKRLLSKEAWSYINSEQQKLDHLMWVVKIRIESSGKVNTLTRCSPANAQKSPSALVSKRMQ
jgi:hypothetical protein